MAKSPIAVAAPGSLVIAGATDATPPELDVRARMAPLTAAGFDLVRQLLWLTAASALVLALVFLAIEGLATARAGDGYKQAIAVASAGRATTDDTALELFAAQLRRGQQDPTWVMSAPDTAAAQSLVKELAKDPAVPPLSQAAFSKCAPLPAALAEGRAETLATCAGAAATLLGMRQAPSERVKLILELQKQHGEQRQAFRAFWMQVAQLILMSLYFPLLTALLGYVFGTQQTQRS